MPPKHGPHKDTIDELVRPLKADEARLEETFPSLQLPAPVDS